MHNMEGNQGKPTASGLWAQSKGVAFGVQYWQLLVALSAVVFVAGVCIAIVGGSMLVSGAVMWSNYGQWRNPTMCTVKSVHLAETKPCKLFGYVEDLCTNVEWQVHASFGDRIIRSNPRISIGAAVRTTEGRDVGQSSLCITNWKNTKAKWYDNEEGKLRTGQWLVLLAGIPFIAGVAVMMVGLSLVHYSFTKQPKPITVTFK